MNANQVLEKEVNKRPWRCKFGWHKWRVIAARPSLVHLPGHVYYLTERCARCPAERTVYIHA